MHILMTHITPLFELQALGAGSRAAGPKGRKLEPDLYYLTGKG